MIAYMSAMTAISGFASGRTIVHRIRSSLAPSSCAASYTSSGMDVRKKTIAMMTCHTPIAFGSSIDHRVSSRPSDCTTRYIGITPPVNSIVKTTPAVMTFRPKRFVRDSG